MRDVDGDAAVRAFDARGGGQLRPGAEVEVEVAVAGVQLDGGELAVDLHAAVRGAGFEGAGRVVDVDVAIGRREMQGAVDVVEGDGPVAGVNGDVAGQVARGDVAVARSRVERQGCGRIYSDLGRLVVIPADVKADVGAFL